MKQIRNFLFPVFGFLLLVSTSRAQDQSGVDSTGLPGDNFSLQGALQMFQDASSPEDFEKAINTEGNHVNNLDLDGNGEIDYVRVISKMDKDAHVFILQVAVSETESQDIAVIELEKTGEESAEIQIVGDEEIYGEQVIVEPDGGEEEGALFNNIQPDHLSGPRTGMFEESPALVVNVWFWPSVRFVYGPAYRPWISPWRWNRYPGWWKPWRPFGWYAWHPLRARYHRNFVICHTHRVIHAHNIYTPYRTTSVMVRTRHSASVNHYRVTRSRTTVTGPAGRKTTVNKTTVTGPHGGKTTVIRGRRHH